MELIFAFVLKFFSVLYGAIYGVLVSIPILKEWLARNRVGIDILGDVISIKNRGWRPFLLLDGHIVAGEHNQSLTRRVLGAGEHLEFPRSSPGDVFVWLRVIDLATGKELVISETLRVKSAKPG